MCRNIKTLFNLAPPASDDEIRAASLQFVRKLSGFNQPSQANQAAFGKAIEVVAAAATELIRSLVTNAAQRGPLSIAYITTGRTAIARQIGPASDKLALFRCSACNTAENKFLPAFDKPASSG